MLKKICLIIGLLCLSSSAFAFDIPQMQSRVNDYADLLTPAQEIELNNRLASYYNLTKHQIFFLSTPTFGDAGSIAEFAEKVFNTWKLGNKDRDDGLLFVISTKEHKVRIEVGYGLEGVVTDAFTGRLLRETIVPSLKSGQNYTAISNGLNSLMQAAQAEVVVNATQKKTVSARAGDDGVLLILFFIFIAIVVPISIIVWMHRRKASRQAHSYDSYSVPRYTPNNSTESITPSARVQNTSNSSAPRHTRSTNTQNTSSPSTTVYVFTETSNSSYSSSDSNSNSSSSDSSSYSSFDSSSSSDFGGSSGGGGSDSSY